jgi:sulfur relay (sulfurtransferase) DsrC/TusE family protein
MTYSQNIKKGMKVEKEHKKTVEFIKAYVQKYDRIPTNEEIYHHISSDHLRENPKYYQKLAKAKL